MLQRKKKMQLPIVHSLKDREEKNAFGQLPWETQGREIIQPSQIHAAGIQGAASCTSKHILPHHGFIHWTKSKAAAINMDNVHQPRLKCLELRHDPSLKGKQLFLLERTKLWAFISPFDDSEDSSKNILFSKVIQMLESHQESIYRVYPCSKTYVHYTWHRSLPQSAKTCSTTARCAPTPLNTAMKPVLQENNPSS